LIDSKFWQGKRVFLTGHSGFKGSWLSLLLSSLGAEVKGYALPPRNLPSLFNEVKIDSIIDSQFGDIRNLKTLHKSMTNFNPSVLIHMAAQPLVRYSYIEPIETFETNVIGTVNVLEAAQSCLNLKAIVNITSDKCYKNDGRSQGYSEEDALGGIDPYSCSKGCAELITTSYRKSFLQNQDIGLASARAGNVIGGGDWSSDRLIPDILRSFQKGEPAVIRNPKAIRPWQHVLDPLSGYLILAQKIYSDNLKYSESWNFGPNEKDTRSVEWILDKMTSKWPNSSWELEKEKESQPHEEDFLRLNILKAKEKLQWEPTWGLNLTLEKILAWHRSWLNQDDMQSLCYLEIEEFMRDMKNEKH